jgi:hypothetical protein
MALARIPEFESYHPDFRVCGCIDGTRRHPARTAMAILGALPMYFHVNPSQTYNPPQGTPSQHAAVKVPRAVPKTLLTDISIRALRSDIFLALTLDAARQA